MGTSTFMKASDLYQKHATGNPVVWKNITQVEETDEYQRSRKKYVQGGMKHLIENKEADILIKPEDHRLHEAVPRQGENQFSARLTKNIRMRYRVEGNRLILENIAPHDDAYH